MLRRVFFASVLAIGLSPSVMSQDYKIVPTPSDSSTNNNSTNEEDRKAWKARMKVALANDPRGYEALKGVYQESTQRRRQQYLDIERRRREAFEAARTTNTRYLNTFGAMSTPTPGAKMEARVGEVSKLQSSENELYQFNKEENDRKNNTSKEINENPEDLERIVDYYSRIEYDSKTLDPETKALMDTLNDVRSNRPDMPQGPQTRRQLLETSNNPANIKALLNDTPPQPNVFVKNVQNITNFKFDSYKSRNLSIDLQIAQVQLLLKEPKLNDKQKKIVREHLETLNKRKELISLDRHKKNVAKLKDTEFMLQEASQLLFPNNKDAQTVVQAFKAGVQIYDAVGSIAISGLTTGGVGLIFSGLNTISGLKGNGPSMDQKIVEMLADIKQSLAEIKQTQAYHGIQLDQIIEGVNALEQSNQQRFVEIRNLVIGGFERSDRLMKQSFADVSIDLTTRPLHGILDSINRNHPRYNGSIRSGYLECMVDEKQCSRETRQRIEDVVEYAAQIQNLITSDLPLKPFASESRTVFDFSSKSAVDGFKSQSEVDDRLGGMLQSMFLWLKAQYDSDLSAALAKAKEEAKGKGKRPETLKVTHEELVEYYVDNPFYDELFHRDEANNVILPDLQVSGLSKVVSPTLITRKLIPEYKTAVAALPLNQGRHGETVHISKMQAVVDDIETLSARMRRNVPLAAAIFFNKIKELDEEIKALKSRWKHPRNIFSDDSLEDIEKHQKQFVDYTYPTDKFYVPPSGLYQSHELAREDSVYMQYLRFLGIVWDERVSHGGSARGIFKLTPSAKNAYDKMVAQGKISPTPDLNAGVLTYYETSGFYSGRPYIIFSKPFDKSREMAINAKKAAMQLTLEIIKQERAQHLNAAVSSMQEKSFQLRLKEVGVAKLVLDTLILGGYGECAFNDTSTAPYSSNLLDLSDKAYESVTEIEVFAARKGYMKFLDMGSHLTIYSRRSDNRMSIADKELLQASMLLIQYKEKFRECSLGLGDTSLANQKLNDIRLMDPEYKIPTIN